MDSKKLQAITHAHFTIKPVGDSLRFNRRSGPCPDCGITVTNRTKIYTKKKNNQGQTHWQSQCTECNQKLPVSLSKELKNNK